MKRINFLRVAALLSTQSNTFFGGKEETEAEKKARLAAEFETPVDTDLQEENDITNSSAKGGKAKKSGNVAVFDSKAMLNKHAEKGTKIKYNDRLKVEIVKKTAYYFVGQVIAPHKVKGEELIAQGIAKKYVEPELEDEA